MSTLMQELERDGRRRARIAGLVVVAVVAGAGAWVSGPFGVVLLTRDEPIGWLLVAAGALLFAACVVAIVAAARTRVLPESLPGKANPAFDEPRPSRNPVGGFAMNGSQIGSQ